MAVATFEELCAGFCELTGVPVPTLARDEHGIVAFHTTVRGVVVDVMHMPQRSSRRVVVLADLGSSLQPDQSIEHTAAALLEANFFPVDDHAAAFAMNPSTKTLTVRYAFTFGEVSPHLLVEVVSAAELALEVRARDAQREGEPRTPSEAIGFA